MSRIAPLLCPLLVGRDDLLDLVDRRIGDAAAGRGHLLLLAGEAGIGKTRLLGALSRKAEAAGLDSAVGALAPQDRHVPGSLVLDMARTMLRIPRFANLGRDLLAMPLGEEGSQPQTRRLVVVGMVDRIVENLESPAMIAFEDLQWADDLSLEVVAELARRTHDRATLLVGAYRTDELLPGSILREWRARLLTQRLAEEARLAPLTLDQTALMTTLIIANGLPAPREVVAAVYERTDGIPLHIEELLGALGDDTRADGRAIREANVPATIEDAVLARFERLSPEGRAVAQAGAVIGRCFVQDVLAGIMDTSPAELDGPLRELVDQAFLDPPGRRGLYDYRHQLLRDALYRTVPPSELRRLHARVGEFGGELEGASEIHASVHFERAGLRAQAFRAALSGARTAAKLSSHREAFELYRRAVENMPADLDPAEQGALYEAYAAEPAAIEIHDVAEQAALTARDRFFEAGRPVDAARQLASIAGIARREAHAIEARSAPIAQGLSELEPLAVTPERELARHVLLIERASCLIDAMDLEAAGDAVVAADAAARAAGDPAGVIFADSIGGMVDVLKGDIDKGLSRIEVAAHEAREAGHEDVGVTAYRNAVTTAVRVMAYDRATRSLADGMRYADAIEQSHCRHVMGSVGALVAWANGRWDEAVASGEQELANRGCSRGTLAAQVALGYVAFGRGKVDDARSLLRAAGAAGDRSGAIDLRLPAMWGLAEADLVDRSATAAIERCEAAFMIAAEVGERALLVPFVVTGVRAALAAGRPADAHRWLDRVAAYLGDISPISPPAVVHGRGLVSLAAGATGLARAALEAAVRGWDELGRTWEATWARLDLASVDLRSSRFAEAASLLADARATAGRLASRPLLDRADELTRVARGRGSLDEPWRPLTSREFEVARLIADGLTNAEIAGELSIASKTASAHVEHILAKLGVARRAEIATWVAAVSRPAGDPSPSRQAALAHR
ncbi:MAG TPA: AAA family ATPase [Candidatus Limnocylindria bacterium]|nr:AAA family ATPase [Candidatus Limnocylindria bacterium]